MRKEFAVKPIALPQPVFIIGTYDKDGTPNAMNAAWGCHNEMDQMMFALAKGHKTVKNLLETKAFTVSMGTVEQLAACDYVGLVSGSKEPRKVEKAGFHAKKALHVNAPYFEELPMTLECEVLSYNEETEILIGRIVGISADESILTGENIDPKKLRPLVFDMANMKYLVAEETVGNAFSEGKKLF